MSDVQGAVCTANFARERREVENFEAAALPHLNSLFRTAAHLAGSRTEAEDLVQEVYLQAWKSFHRFELGTNCRAWLFKILFNKFNHHRRRRFKLNRVTESATLLEETISYEPAVPEHLSDEAILSAFGKLQQCYREVVMLADVQEASYAEIAAILGVPMGTVMSRLSRGRELLRVNLAGVAEVYGIGGSSFTPPSGRMKVSKQSTC